jgi:hypothetical protein
MRRRALVATVVTVGLGSGVALVVHGTATSARSEAKVAAAATPAAKEGAVALPISQVALFSSGVGYFQRDGQVDGSCRVDLSFQTQDVNDLLKSLVLQDLGGGHVNAVSYDSQAPVEKTLRSFAINLHGNPTFGQILGQARGEKVEATLGTTPGGQPNSMVGVVMGLEQKREAVGKDVVEGEFLTLWCAEGMRSVRLGDVQRVRFLNPVLDGEIKKALEALAQAHDTQKKAVSLHFEGDGKRAVKVGYVVENPIWKTSYRLVLDKKGKAFLQGWAIVENTQDDDWTDVNMRLISGRPISFQMDLYQPLFVQRPVVEPELFASLRPPTYSGNLTNNDLGKDPEVATNYDADRMSDVSVPGPTHPGALVGFMGRTGATREKMVRQGGGIMDPRGSAPSAVVATDLGDFFQYQIEHPVTLARQKSALLPIVNEDVDAARVSIYNPATHPKFPLLGLKFKNTTALHLMQGPVTVFDGTAYAGDARIQDLQPKEDRLLSYAIDLGTEVEPTVPHTPDRLTKVVVRNGLIQTTHRFHQEKVYNLKNRSEQDRTVIIEHPYRADLTLTAPEKFSERARDVYRFEVPVKAHGTAKLVVAEERDLIQNIALSNTDDNTFKFFLNSQLSSPAVKKALETAAGLKGKLQESRRELAHVERQLKDVRDDQNRLREDLKVVPQTSAAYKRYVEKFDKQETEIEQYQARVKALQNAEHLQGEEFNRFLANLNLD